MTEARYLVLGSYVCLAALVLVSAFFPPWSLGNLVDGLMWCFALLGWLGLYYAIARRDLLAGLACAVPVGLTVLFLLVVFHPRD
jgi:hypothetical protein